MATKRDGMRSFKECRVGIWMVFYKKGRLLARHLRGGVAVVRGALPPGCLRQAISGFASGSPGKSVLPPCTTATYTSTTEP